MSSSGLESPSRAHAEAEAALVRKQLEVRDRIEALARMRRALPEGPRVLGDYTFMEGPRDLDRNEPGDHRRISLRDLFTDPSRPLLLVHFMYGAGDSRPCPMCSLWADGYAGVAAHLGDHANLAVVAQAEIGKFRAWARGRQWHGLRLLSSAGTSFNRDFGAETEDGGQVPGVSVLVRTPDGTIRRFLSQWAMPAPGEYRGMDLLSPFWNFLDLLPAGRGVGLPAGTEA